MLDSYTIWIDGKPYGGESDVVDAAPAGGDGGWNGFSPETRSGLRIGNCDPYVAEGVRNLSSHVHRVLTRIREQRLAADEITIRRERRE